MSLDYSHWNLSSDCTVIRRMNDITICCCTCYIFSYVNIKRKVTKFRGTLFCNFILQLWNLFANNYIYASLLLDISFMFCIDHNHATWNKNIFLVFTNETPLNLNFTLPYNFFTETYTCVPLSNINSWPSSTL